jgi:predicted RNA polymerase sigma factor
LQLYNGLLQTAYSPIAALNRTLARAKANGKEKAIIEAEKLQLTGNHYYFTLLGGLYKDRNPAKAKENFKKALAPAKTNGDRRLLQKKLEQSG